MLDRIRPKARTGVQVAVSAALTAWPVIAVAQQGFPPPPPPGWAAPPPAIQQRWPDPIPPPGAPPPRVQTEQPATQSPGRPTATPKPSVAAKPPAAPAYAVTCIGVFAKDTNHLKLAVKYDSQNIALTDVDGPDQAKLKATVLFPRDPKRRLEVLWDDEAGRTGVQVISINGQSNWSAPKGLKLGLSVPALEKLNNRPFKISGFRPDGNANVLDWQGGALASLPGACKVGVRLSIDRSTTQTARNAVGGELLSNAAALKAVKAQVAEILLGY